METRFIHSKKSKISDPHRLLLRLLDKINLKGSDKYFALSNLSIYYTWKDIQKQQKNFKVLSPTWNEKFELPDGSYSVFEIQDYFKYIIKKHETVTDNPPIIIFVNKIENVITFGINTEYYLKLLA